MAYNMWQETGTYREAARQLGITPSTVRRRVQRHIATMPRLTVEQVREDARRLRELEDKIAAKLNGGKAVRS